MNSNKVNHCKYYRLFIVIYMTYFGTEEPEDEQLCKAVLISLILHYTIITNNRWILICLYFVAIVSSFIGTIINQFCIGYFISSYFQLIRVRYKVRSIIF